VLLWGCLTRVVGAATWLHLLCMAHRHTGLRRGDASSTFRRERPRPCSLRTRLQMPAYTGSGTPFDGQSPRCASICPGTHAWIEVPARLSSFGGVKRVLCRVPKITQGASAWVLYAEKVLCSTYGSQQQGCVTGAGMPSPTSTTPCASRLGSLQIGRHSCSLARDP
jgi:hypothetical protein